MTLRTTVYARCIGHTGIEALVGTRVYPDRLPEDVTYPAMTYFCVSADNTLFRSHDGGPTEYETSRVQFNCYDETGDGAAALADQVRLAWDGYVSGCDVCPAWQVNRLMTREDAVNAYRAIVDVMIEHSID